MTRGLRQILIEQFEVVYGGGRTTDATIHAEAILQLYLDVNEPDDVERYCILRCLFNSDIRVAGRVPHLENGCCRSPQHTLSLMLSIGVKALLPSCIDVIKRNHWTGLENAIGQVGVPSKIHALLQQAALRVLVKKLVNLDGLSRAVPAAASSADGEPDDFEGID